MASASIVKTSIALIYEEIDRLGAWDDFKLVLQVHDEEVWEVKDSFVDQAKEIVEQSMLQAGKIFCKRLDIPASVTISKHWKK